MSFTIIHSSTFHWNVKQTNEGKQQRSTDKRHNNRLESPMGTPPGMRVNTENINSTKGTSSTMEYNFFGVDGKRYDSYLQIR